MKSRFERFVKALDGYEAIDDLTEAAAFPRKKRADYFFESRSIIVEQKSLEIEPTERPQKFVDRLVTERNILVYGQTSTKVIFDKLPDGRKLQHELMIRITRCIESIISTADKQTRDTREIFGCQEAPGIVVILNEQVTMLPPDVIGYGLAHVFQKKLEGELQYPHNDGVILISEAHILANKNGIKLFPILTFTSPNETRKASVLSFSEILMEKWAQHNGVPLLRPQRST